MANTSRTHLTALDYVALGLVQQPTHAYEMFQQFNPELPLGMLWHLKQSHLYAVLARLEQLGFFSVTIEPQGARPPRRMLHLTEAGRATLDAWLAAPVAHGRDVRQEFLAKLYFSAQRGPEVARLLVSQQKATMQAWRAEVQQHLDAQAQPYARLVLRYRLGQIDAALAWLAECAATLM